MLTQPTAKIMTPDFGNIKFFIFSVYRAFPIWSFKLIHPTRINEQGIMVVWQGLYSPCLIETASRIFRTSWSNSELYAGPHSNHRCCKLKVSIIILVFHSPTNSLIYFLALFHRILFLFYHLLFRSPKFSAITEIIVTPSQHSELQLSFLRNNEYVAKFSSLPLVVGTWTVYNFFHMDGIF